jgi:hypothetical protein
LDVFAFLVYAPFLLCLPALLVVGLVFVVVPGGFIVVLSALYYASVGFIGLVGMAAASRGRPGSSRRAAGGSKHREGVTIGSILVGPARSGRGETGARRVQ